MSRLLLLFIPVLFLTGFFIALIAERRKDIARLLTGVTIVFLFLAMILALMPEIKTWIWLNNFVLLVAWVAAFATAIKYFRGQKQQRGTAFGISCLLIVMVAVFTFGNAHMQKQLKEALCSYVDCDTAKPELVDADFFILNAQLDSVNTLTRGEKYRFILVDSFYAGADGFIKMVPGFSALKNDSVKALTLSVWREGRKVKTLNTCITEAREPLEEYGRFLSLSIPRYDSLEVLRDDLNYAMDDDFNAIELGSEGLEFAFLLPEKSGLNGEYEMRLEFVFNSGKRISKRRKMTIL